MNEVVRCGTAVAATRVGDGFVKGPTNSLLQRRKRRRQSAAADSGAKGLLTNKLTCLSLRDTAVSDELVSRCSGLRSLDVRGNLRVGDSTLLQLALFRELQVVRLAGSSVTSCGVTALASWCHALARIPLEFHCQNGHPIR